MHFKMMHIVVRAFHLKWADQQLDSNVHKWDVLVLALDRYRRHLDRANLQEFWTQLDRFI